MVNVGAYLNWKMCYYLVYAAPRHHRNYTLACYSTTMATTHVFALMLIEYMGRCIVLALDEQKVRWYWCMFEFEYVIAWYTMRYIYICILRSQLHTRLIFNYNGNAIRLWADVNVTCMYGTQWQMAAR